MQKLNNNVFSNNIINIFQRTPIFIKRGIAMNIERLGWDNYFEEHFKAFSDRGLFPARVISQ